MLSTDEHLYTHTMLLFIYRMDLVEIMGKKNKKVPVLLTPSIREALDLLNHTRNDVGISESNPYVFAKVLVFLQIQIWLFC